MGNDENKGSKFVRVRLGPVTRWGVSSLSKAVGTGKEDWLSKKESNQRRSGG